VNWEPPTENTDDSPLDNLAGFRIYWGTDPDAPTSVVAVNGPGITAYYFRDLVPGAYYFATAAVNSFGVESALSDPVLMIVR
jgi:hypothetical protein